MKITLCGWHCVKNFVDALLVSHCCHNKWVKCSGSKIQTYYLTVPKVRSLKWVLGLCSFWRLGGESFSLPLFLGSWPCLSLGLQLLWFDTLVSLLSLLTLAITLASPTIPSTFLSQDPWSHRQSSFFYARQQTASAGQCDVDLFGDDCFTYHIWLL